MAPFSRTAERFAHRSARTTVKAEMYRAMSDRYPKIGALVEIVMNDDSSVVGNRGCDDQFEFEFALDLMLDGLDRIRDRS